MPDTHRLRPRVRNDFPSTLAYTALVTPRHHVRVAYAQLLCGSMLVLSVTAVMATAILQHNINAARNVAAGSSTGFWLLVRRGTSVRVTNDSPNGFSSFVCEGADSWREM